MTREPDDYEEWGDEDDDEAELLACPSCGQRVHEDAQQCPYCRDWIIPVDPADRARRVVWTVAAVLVVASLLLFTVW